MRQPYQRVCRSCRLVVTVDVTMRISHLTPYCSHTLSWFDIRTTLLSRVALTPHSRVGLLKGALSESLSLTNY